MPPFIQNILALPAKTKALLGVSAFAILAIAFVMLRIATAPSYALIASGLDPAQTGKITAALDEQGIGYELRNNGTALAVSKSQTAQARIALSAQGVTTTGGGDQPGNELLDESKLGASQFQQQQTAQRALEGEVAKTLRGVEGVSNPRVQIDTSGLSPDATRLANVLAERIRGLDRAQIADILEILRPRRSRNQKSA